LPRKKNAAEPYFAPGEDQGMLARPAFWMQDSERYPRGYNPERMREVSEAIEGTKRLSGDPEEVAQMKEDVARSTVPASDLRNLDIVRAGNTSDAVNESGVSGWFKPGMEAEQPHPSAKYTESASYRLKDGSEEQLPVSRLHVTVRSGTSRNERSRALIHALGHHAENLPVLDKRQSLWDSGTGPSEAAEQVGTSSQWDADTLASKEASAEDYADIHHRDDRRSEPAGKSFWDTTSEENQKSEGNLGRFSRSYARRRNLSTQFDAVEGQKEITDGNS